MKLKGQSMSFSLPMLKGQWAKKIDHSITLAYEID
jgi:hypothetical protein